MSLSPSTDSEARSQQALRVPMQAPVRLKFKDLAGFVNAQAANISRTGMFIRTQQPRPAGTFLRFELRLGEDFGAIKGDGQVVWIRWDDESPERPAGMGIRFWEIEPGSREQVFRVVDRHVQRVGEPSEN